LKIIKEFAPIVEIGCGANAYWASCMKQEGINVIAYDMHVETGGKIKQKDAAASTKHQQKTSMMRKGGPSILKQHGDRTLFLCYPDEDGEGMGAECLENFVGTHVIHVGETFLDSNFASDQACFGRSSSSEFQERLASEFHCLVKVELPNWLHVRDSISVWKRSQTSTIVFAADSDDDEEEDEEIEYRHIPCDERLPMNVAAPCCAHLLPQTTVTTPPESSFKQKEKSKSRSNSGDSLSRKDKVKANKTTTEGEDAVGSATRSRADSTDSVGKKKGDRSNSTDSATKKKRERSDSTDSERKRKRGKKGQDSSLPAGRERSDSTDSAKKRKKLEKNHQQSVDSLFGGGFGEDDDDQSSPSGRRSHGEYASPW
jgi:hypothetical protein